MCWSDLQALLPFARRNRLPAGGQLPPNVERVTSWADIGERLKKRLAAKAAAGQQ